MSFIRPLGSVDPSRVLAPFLDLLKAPYLAGPFKLVALDALQTFISGNLLCSNFVENNTPTDRLNIQNFREALASVVDAVARCIVNHITCCLLLLYFLKSSNITLIARCIVNFSQMQVCPN